MPAELSNQLSQSHPVFNVLTEGADHPPVTLDRAVCVVGRRSGVNLPLPAAGVSKFHALIVRDSHGVYVRDLASTNGVELNGARIDEAGLADEDMVRIGSYTLYCASGFSNGSAGESTDAQPAPAELRTHGASFPFPPGRHTLLIGHRQGCDVRIDDASVAPIHAVLFEVNGKRFVQDLGGAPGGTRINGQPIHRAELNPGDVLEVGQVALNYALSLHVEIEPPIQPPIEPEVGAELEAEPEAVAAIDIEGDAAIDSVDAIEAEAPVEVEAPLEAGSEIPLASDAGNVPLSESPAPVQRDPEPAAPSQEAIEIADELEEKPPSESVLDVSPLPVAPQRAPAPPPAPAPSAPPSPAAKVSRPAPPPAPVEEPIEEWEDDELDELSDSDIPPLRFDTPEPEPDPQMTNLVEAEPPPLVWEGVDDEEPAEESDVELPMPVDEVKRKPRRLKKA